MVLLAAAALAGTAPGLAHAATLVPAATFYNAVSAVDPDPYPGEQPFASQSTSLPTGGIAISGSGPTANSNYSASTSNNYGVPSVSAQASAEDRAKAAAGSSLFYYVEFGSTTASTVTMRVSASGGAILAADVDGAYAGTRSQNFADAAMSISDQLGHGNLVAVGVSSDLIYNPGLQAFNFDQTVTFQTNLVYQILIQSSVTATYQHSGTAYVDPYFYVPDGITFSISDGIGNALPNSGETPIPAALPLFVSGLGGLGYLARRRRRRSVAA